MFEVMMGVGLFTAIVMVLAVIILIAKAHLAPQGDITITINDDADKSFSVPAGGKLLSVLASKKIFLSSACGGGGSCAQCKVTVKSGGGEPLATETPHLTRQQIKEGVRLSCQVPVKQNMEIIVPDEVFATKQWECEVLSNHNVATFIKELVLKLPAGEKLYFRAGGYIQIEAPSYELSFTDFAVKDEYRADWDKQNLWKYRSVSKEPVIRAYSMANYPEESEIIMLNVRIATPPAPVADAPPGLVSSYIFNLKPGDKVTVSGPYGEFFAKETNAEMVFVGGGAGMAPMRSHILDQLLRIKTKRKVTFWYGARSRREMFYEDVFNNLQEEYDNFKWYVALSDPQPEDDWKGDTGFIHNVLYERYLKDHLEPEECEYYICGPPVMLQSVIRMLKNLGVEDENIMFDDFGS
jgi:Na+-transporting NADH:ubiquinone oxidoreductase subunit F